MKAQGIKKIAILNGTLTIPKGYKSYLNLGETEEAIKVIKNTF